MLPAEVKGPEVDQGGLERANPFSRDQWFESISLHRRVQRTPLLLADLASAKELIAAPSPSIDPSAEHVVADEAGTVGAWQAMIGRGVTRFCKGL